MPKSIKLIKKLAILLLLFSAIKFSSAQNDIKIFSQDGPKSNYDFTVEWEYLSTDLYLFNSNQFEDLINKAYQTDKGGLFKKRNSQKLKSLVVTAELQDLANYKNVKFPIYSFKITEKEKGGYSIQSSEFEVISLVDKVGAGEKLDAKIDAKIITDDNKGFVYKLLATQLKNISSISNPTDAVLKLVGDLGDMLEKEAQGNDYHFESTIRLYEDEDFNEKRFHSLKVFVFSPAGTKQSNLNLKKLNEYFAENPNVSITKELLKEKIGYYQYPYMVSVNYRSKYKAVNSDILDSEDLRTRKNEVDEKCKTIDEALCQQEKELTSFLEIMVRLNNLVNNYNISYENLHNPIEKQLEILQVFYELKNRHYTTKLTYENKTEFEYEFAERYDNTIRDAESLLAKNQLQNVKTLTIRLFELNTNPEKNLDSLTTENYLRDLRLINFPDDMEKLEYVKKINGWIVRLENEHYNNSFRKVSEDLKNAELTKENKDKAIMLQNTINTTNCVLCRELTSVAISEFNEKYKEKQRQQALEDINNLISETRIEIYNLQKKGEAIKTKIDTIYANQKPSHILTIENSLNKTFEDIAQLNSIIDKNYSTEKLENIKIAIKSITELAERIRSSFAIICTQEPELCEE